MIDWLEFHRADARTPSVVDPQRRLQIGRIALVLLLGVVLIRAVLLEVAQGPAFRAEAATPIRRQTELPPVRGRILTRDGLVLACDHETSALALAYRQIETPPDAAWLARMASKRLTKAQRRNPARVAEEKSLIQAETADLHKRLADLCGISHEAWQQRTREIQTRVERIAASANRRRTAPGEITVAEELADHIVVDDVSPTIVAAIEGQPEQWPGARIVHPSRRIYPAGSLASHVVGHLGHADEGDRSMFSDNIASEIQRRFAEKWTSPRPANELVGRMGVERQCQARLQGRPGLAIEMTDHGGRRLSTYHEIEPSPGSDVVLTLDSRMQRAAEELLDSALQRRALQAESPESAGGAIAVMDVQSGELLVAASAPRFDPGAFVGLDGKRRQALLDDPGHPLFHRVIQMALPPGSVFKTATALALLDSQHLDPREPFHCQGYWKQPDRLRCAVYVRHGVGHGEVTLADALAQSCNVYFFHHAAELGPTVLVDWAARLGYGCPTGVDLPGEAAGSLPHSRNPALPEGQARRIADAQNLAIGQGTLTATPLQVLRMMAAVANGGLLVTPCVVKEVKAIENADPIEVDSEAIRPGPIRVPGLTAESLAAVREGLRRVVDDPKGTAYGSVRLDSVAIAGKTGTASVGADRADHAWFAGYFPAEKPRYAIVVVLEHAGDAATAAGPVVKRLVQRISE